MRVLVLTNLYPPHSYGGYERACAQVVERWREAGHVVEVLTSDHRIGAIADGPEEAGVERALDFYWRDHVVVGPPPWKRFRIERRNRQVIDQTVGRFRPDVVSVWNHGAMSYALLAELLEHELPLVLVVADNWLCWGPDYDMWTRMFEGHGPVARRLGDLVGALTGIPTRFPDLGRHALPVYASEFLRRRSERESRFTFERSAVVSWGIDLEQFSMELPPEVSEEPRCVVFVGRIDERKGVHTAIRALAHLDGMVLSLVGPATNDAEAQLRSVAADAGVSDRIRRAEADADDIEQHYRGGDIALFPSEWEEPFGLVGLEAMASGVPLVATGSGGSAEYLVDGENALLVPPGDAIALAAAVQRLARDPVLRRRLVARGLETARRYDIDLMADELLQHHRAVVDAG